MGNLKLRLIFGILALAFTISAGAALSPAVSQAGESIGKFTVQVAAFDDEVKAKEFTADLKTKGLKPFIIPVQIKGHAWYRIGVGLFATEGETIRFRTQLLNKTKLPEAIIRIVD